MCGLLCALLCCVFFFFCEVTCPSPHCRNMCWLSAMPTFFFPQETATCRSRTQILSSPSQWLFLSEHLRRGSAVRFHFCFALKWETCEKLKSGSDLFLLLNSYLLSVARQTGSISSNVPIKLHFICESLMAAAITVISTFTVRHAQSGSI